MFGLSEKGFKRKRYEDIIADMNSRAKSLFGDNINLFENSPMGLFLRAIAWFVAVLWQLAEKVYSSAYVDTAEGVSLAHVGKYVGISPRPAERARFKSDGSPAEIVIKGEPGAFIGKGMLLSTKGDVFFRVTEDSALNERGEARARIEAVEPGHSGNVPANTITVIVNPVAGIESVNNPESVTGGRDKETDVEFRERYYRSASKGGSSTAPSIEAALLDLPNVKDAVVEENTTMEVVNDLPPKCIAPYVFGGDDMEIAKTIFEAKAGGIRSFGNDEITVIDSRGKEHIIGFTRPEMLSVYVEIVLTTDASFPPNGNQLVRTEIIRYIGGQDEDGTLFDGLGQGKGVILIKIIAAIDKVPGVTDAQIKIGKSINNLESRNITISSRQVAETDWEKVKVL